MRRPRLCAQSPDATGSSLEPARDRWRRSPWYFPTPGDYATRLERAGFWVDSIALIPRPTPLPGDVVDWLETFAQTFLHGLPGVARAEYLQEVRAVLEPQLRDSTGTWVADYVRLRFAAT